MLDKPDRGRLWSLIKYLVPRDWVITAGATVLTAVVGVATHDPLVAILSGAFIFCVVANTLHVQEARDERRRPQPEIFIHIENGPPWDDETYMLPPPTPPSLGRLSFALGGLTGPQIASPPQPVERGVNHGKKIAIVNTGNAVAQGCRVVITSPFRVNVPLKWENYGGELLDKRTLAIDEQEYVIFPAGLFVMESECDVRVRVFCDDDPLGPAEAVFRWRVAQDAFPEVLDRLDE